MSLAKRWCFTLNNYTEEDKRRVEDLLTEQVCVFAVVGLEVGSVAATEHMQGFVHFRSRKTFRAMQKLLPGAHLEVARASDVEFFFFLIDFDGKTVFALK